jgi:sulfite reductase (NADPH) flavoprotein alpha-component
VSRILHFLGVAPDVPVLSHEGRSLREVLTRSLDLRRPREELISLLADVAKDDLEAAMLREAVDRESTDEVADLLERFPSARPELNAFLGTLGKLQPRLYSISSSQRAHPNEVHLTVGVVRYEENGRARRGVASTFLAERLELGRSADVFVQQSHGFRLPENDSTPVIMVGPGTGVAPFRAFLQERVVRKAAGRNWLFFGDQKSACDFLYCDEIRDYERRGVLHRLDVAFSRDQSEKLYVQHRMGEQGAELWRWIEAGACFYVCGDAKRMARDVDAALHEIVAEHGCRSTADAKEYVHRMSLEKRYARDVY